MADIFLSYKKEDRAVAARMVSALVAAGYTVWWDNDITPRQTWDAEIENEIAAASAVVVLWTELSAAQGTFVRNEATFGDKHNKLVPFLIRDCVIPLAFCLIQAADLRAWRAEDFEHPEWQRALSWIAALVGREPLSATHDSQAEEVTRSWLAALEPILARARAAPERDRDSLFAQLPAPSGPIVPSMLPHNLFSIFSRTHYAEHAPTVSAAVRSELKPTPGTRGGEMLCQLVEEYSSPYDQGTNVIHAHRWRYVRGAATSTAPSPHALQWINGMRSGVKEAQAAHDKNQGGPFHADGFVAMNRLEQIFREMPDFPARSISVREAPPDVLNFSVFGIWATDTLDGVALEVSSAWENTADARTLRATMRSRSTTDHPKHQPTVIERTWVFGV